jgi:hypothetical protein
VPFAACPGVAQMFSYPEIAQIASQTRGSRLGAPEVTPPTARLLALEEKRSFHRWHAWEHFLRGGVVSLMSHCTIGEHTMLPFFALTYTAARLGWQAQSAGAFRLLRLGAGITSAADKTAGERPVPAARIAEALVAASPKQRHAAKKVHKKSALVGKPGKRAKRV